CCTLYFVMLPQSMSSAPSTVLIVGLSHIRGWGGGSPSRGKSTQPAQFRGKNKRIFAQTSARAHSLRPQHHPPVDIPPMKCERSCPARGGSTMQSAPAHGLGRRTSAPLGLETRCCFA